MNNEYRKKVAENLINSVTPDNVEQIYKRNFTRFLFENSDEVIINGKDYGNSKEDKITRACFMFPDEKGESNIITASGCNTKGGFPITELDFINNQLQILDDLFFEDFHKQKKYELYLKVVKKWQEYRDETIHYLHLDPTQPTKYLEEFNYILSRYFEMVKIEKDNVKVFNEIRFRIETKDKTKQILDLAIKEIKNIVLSKNEKSIPKYYLKNFINLRKELKTEMSSEDRIKSGAYINILKGYLDEIINEIENFAGFSESEPQLEVKEIEPPFSITGNFELFKYLDKMFKPESKVKYTYIFDFIKENLENTLNVDLYFNYIAKLKPHLGLKTLRPQPTATNEKSRELVKKLYQNYLNETTK